MSEYESRDKFYCEIKTNVRYDKDTMPHCGTVGGILNRTQCDKESWNTNKTNVMAVHKNRTFLNWSYLKGA